MDERRGATEAKWSGDIQLMWEAWKALDALPNHLKQATEAGPTLHNLRVLLAEKGVKVPR